MADAEHARAFFTAAAGIERHPVEPGELHPLRSQDVTASVAAALFGLHPYTTIARLHAEKLGIKLPEVDPMSGPIRRGKAAEKYAPDELALADGWNPQWRLERCLEYFRDPAARLGCSPDFWVLGDERGLGVLQFKTVAPGEHKASWRDQDDEKKINPPMWVVVQNTVECMLTGAAFGVIGELVIGSYHWDPYLVEVPRHADGEARIREATAAFWRKLSAGEMPEVDFARDGKLISLMFPRETPGAVIDLRGDNRVVELLEERERQAGFIKQAELRKDAAEAEIKTKIGTAETALVRGWRCSFKLQNRKGFEVKPTSFRVLRTIREVDG